MSWIAYAIAGLLTFGAAALLLTRRLSEYEDTPRTYEEDEI